MVALNLDSNIDELHTVLIISKDVDLVRVWESLSDQKSYRIFSETSAKSGAQSARVLTPALIVLDLDLPEDEQVNLCRELRASTNGTILLLASERDKAEIAEYLRAGVDEFIATPVSPMALLIKAMTWLARQDWIVPRRKVLHMAA